MKKPAPLPMPQVASGKKKRRAPELHPAQNTALNAQNRRVLAQHYRAKYGVK